jgi:energy-coupling factor transport system substrate-specific component
MRASLSKTRFLALVVVCAALNIGIGSAVAALKLPFFLDSIGTLVATSLGGLGAGLVTALLGTTLGTAVAPSVWAYSGTAIAIALYARLLRPAGFLRKPLPTIFFGLLLGVVTAILSAPVTAFVFQGVTLSGADALVPFLVATGHQMLASTALSGLSNDPIDKLVTSLIAYALLSRVPSVWMAEDVATQLPSTDAPPASPERTPGA